MATTAAPARRVRARRPTPRGPVPPDAQHAGQHRRAGLNRDDFDRARVQEASYKSELGEAADYIRAVKPERVIQIHELMLSDLGQASTASLLGENGLTGIPISRVEPGTTVRL